MSSLSTKHHICNQQQKQLLDNKCLHFQQIHQVLGLTLSGLGKQQIAQQHFEHNKNFVHDVADAGAKNINSWKKEKKDIMPRDSMRDSMQSCFSSSANPSSPSSSSASATVTSKVSSTTTTTTTTTTQSSCCDEDCDPCWTRNQTYYRWQSQQQQQLQQQEISRKRMRDESESENNVIAGEERGREIIKRIRVGGSPIICKSSPAKLQTLPSSFCFEQKQPLKTARQVEAKLTEDVQTPIPSPDVRPLATLLDKQKLDDKMNSCNKNILVLDLDETLIHTEQGNHQDKHFLITLQHQQLSLYVRPHLEYFLEKVSSMFAEIVLFTAAQKDYAEEILKIIDPKMKYFGRCFFRDSCSYSLRKDNNNNNANVEKGTYYKDLTIVTKDLSRVCLIDNSPLCFNLQPLNGLQILSYYKNNQDNTLMCFCDILKGIASARDVREHLTEMKKNAFEIMNKQMNMMKNFTNEMTNKRIMPRNNIIVSNNDKHLRHHHHHQNRLDENLHLLQTPATHLCQLETKLNNLNVQSSLPLRSFQVENNDNRSLQAQNTCLPTAFALSCDKSISANTPAVNNNNYTQSPNSQQTSQTYFSS